MMPLESLNYIIDDYIIHCRKGTLYAYIDEYISFLESRQEEMIKNHKFRNISRRIEKALRGKTSLVLFNINIDLIFYYYNFADNLVSLNPNMASFCKKWDSIFEKHQIKKIIKVMIPAQNRFKERLYNPHTEIGNYFMKKKMDELPWEETI
jgi:hypothetical protein